jgi:murein DD-endopeptidase MepM/ murein hydrolase activator NlpD
MAPAPGRVSFVGRKFAFGLVVEVTHAEGVVTRYAHLRSAAVKSGDQVTRGETIAAVGSSGLSTGPHLHYEILVQGRQVDPLRFKLPQGNETGSSVTPTVNSAAPPAAAGAMGQDEAAASPTAPPPR